MAKKGSVGIVKTQHVKFDKEISLELGEKLGPVTVAYETYGELNKDRSNAILVVHALSGDAHAAGYHTPKDKNPGWWDLMIGPGKPIDTKKYFVICSNFLGGCKGTTGPSSVNPKTKKPYGTSFPVITVSDMVRVQKMLLDHLGIENLASVIGGSMGGMQALEWGIQFPDMPKSIVVIASCPYLSTQAIAFDEVARHAIISDPEWKNGRYYGKKQKKISGLAIARMIGHITYLSEEGMKKKFGRHIQTDAYKRFDLSDKFHSGKMFSVESYLIHQGFKFLERFDANSYLYILEAMDEFDIAEKYGNNSLVKALKKVKAETFVVSFTSDWLFPPEQSREIVEALRKNDKDVSYLEVESNYGHDSFLLENKVFEEAIKNFLHHIKTGKVKI